MQGPRGQLQNARKIRKYVLLDKIMIDVEAELHVSLDRGATINDNLYLKSRLSVCLYPFYSETKIDRDLISFEL